MGCTDTGLIRTSVASAAVEVLTLGAVPPLVVAKLFDAVWFARFSWWGVMAPALAGFGVGLIAQIAVATTCVVMLVCDLDGRRLNSARGAVLGRPAQFMSIRLKASYLSFTLLAVALSAVGSITTVATAAALTVSPHALAALTLLLGLVAGACSAMSWFAANVSARAPLVAGCFAAAVLALYLWHGFGVGHVLAPLAPLLLAVAIAGDALVSLALRIAFSSMRLTRAQWIIFVFDAIALLAAAAAAAIGGSVALNASESERVVGRGPGAAVLRALPAAELAPAAFAATLLTAATTFFAVALLLRLLPRVASPYSGVAMEGQAQWLHLVGGGRAELVRQRSGSASRTTGVAATEAREAAPGEQAEATEGEEGKGRGHFIPVLSQLGADGVTVRNELGTWSLLLGWIAPVEKGKDEEEEGGRGSRKGAGAHEQTEAPSRRRARHSGAILRLCCGSAVLEALGCWCFCRDRGAAAEARCTARHRVCCTRKEARADT